MGERAVITGLGLVTPLGLGVDATWNALLAGKYITNHSRIHFATPASLVLPSENRKRDAGVAATLAINAALEAVEQRRWQGDGPTALVVGTSKGAVTSWLDDLAPLPHMDDAACVAGGLDHGLASIGVEVGKALRLPDGPRLTVSAACASGLVALVRAAMMIQSGEVKRALVVAAEASVHPLFIGCFQRLGVLPREEIGCRPFDQHRDGFLISEAAAAVCLEAAESDSTPRPQPWAAIDRFALGGDATHITGSDSSGEVLGRLLDGLELGRGVDLIHAHATGTVSNDPVELTAYEHACAEAETAPIVYSHKGALGHTLGASGLVSVVLNCMSHRTGIVPGNVRTTRPLVSRRVRIPREVQKRDIRRSAAIAAGFGGAMAGIALISQ